MRFIQSWLFDLGLWPRVALLISLGFLTLFAVISALGEWALRDNAGQIVKERQIIAQMAAGRIEGLLEELVLGLEQSRRLAGFNPTDPQLASAVKILTHTYSGLVFLDPKGWVVWSQPSGLYPPGTDLSALPHVAHALERQELAISEPLLEPLRKQPTIAITLPIYDGSRFVGLLSGLVDLHGPGIMTPLQQAATLGDTAHAALVDSQGRALVSTFDLPFLSPGEHVTFYRRAMAQGEPVVETIPFELAGVPNEALGHLHVMAFAPLKNVPWGVAVGGDVVEETFAGVYRLRLGLVIIGTLFLAIIWVATLAATQRLVRPVLHLTKAAQQIAHGELYTPLQTTEGGEIGVMAAALEHMRKQLLANIEQLSTLNETLADRVAEQTEELHQQQTTLSSVEQTIHSPLDLSEMLEQILTQTREACGVTQGALFLYDEKTETLAPFIVQRAGAEQLENLQVLASQTIKQQQSWSIFEEERASVLSIPLTLDNIILGALLLADRRPQAFSQRQITLLSTVASQTAFILRNNQLYALLEDRAILEERSRLAREIHDNEVQTLGYLKLQLSRMQGWVRNGDLDRLEGEVNDLRGILEEAYGEARDAIAGLRVGLNPEDTLESILTEYVSSFSARFQIPVEILIEGSAYRFQPTAIFHLLRIVQEALTNVRKHAQASRAWVKVHYGSDRLALIIGDDGQGLDLQVMDRAKLRGVQFMRERAESLGGELAIRSQHPQGTEVQVTVLDLNQVRLRDQAKGDSS